MTRKKQNEVFHKILMYFYLNKKNKVYSQGYISNYLNNISRFHRFRITFSVINICLCVRRGYLDFVIPAPADVPIEPGLSSLLLVHSLSQLSFLEISTAAKAFVQ